MKLFRFGQEGEESPGLLIDDQRGVDLSSIVGDFDPGTIGPDLTARLAGVDPGALPAVDLAKERIGSPIARPGTIFCIGLNYIDHAKEAGMAVPEEPVVFSKAASALSGPNDPILFRPEMTKLDWEVELGIVIGRPLVDAGEAEAASAIFGFTIVNDVSERAWQLEKGGQWIKGKSYPSFCPTGPWLVTADEVADCQALDLWLDVNGEPRQRGTTASMIFSAATIISYLSGFCRLMPGDLICTGTPHGVGAGMKPPTFLKAGDRVSAGISGLGAQSQLVTPL